jgi:hypothetical protein
MAASRRFGGSYYAQDDIRDHVDSLASLYKRVYIRGIMF